MVTSRITKEGWSLLTDSTEANGDSMSTNEKGPSWLVSWALSIRTDTRDFCTALVALVGLVKYIYFFTVSIIGLHASPSKLGRQS